jgi:hypothetical protein
VRGDFERAAELFEESLAIGEARGDLDRRARALNNLGWATQGLGDLAGMASWISARRSVGPDDRTARLVESWRRRFGSEA